MVKRWFSFAPLELYLTDDGERVRATVYHFFTAPNHGGRVCFGGGPKLEIRWVVATWVWLRMRGWDFAGTMSGSMVGKCGKGRAFRIGGRSGDVQSRWASVVV